MKNKMKKNKNKKNTKPHNYDVKIKEFNLHKSQTDTRAHTIKHTHKTS